MRATICILLCSWLLPVKSSAFVTIHDGGGRRRPTTSLQMAATMIASRSVGKLDPATTAMLMCDIQDRYRPLMYRGETVINTARYMLGVADALDIPVVATQQYTKVLGPTVPECFISSEQQESIPVFEKKLFSMMTPEVTKRLQELNKKSYILFGLEAHVCLQQTALDLLEQGKEVHIVVDGVSSQQPVDREVALQRLAGCGAFLTTAQAAAFMLTKSADHPNFKTVSKLTAEHIKLPEIQNPPPNDFIGALW